MHTIGHGIWREIEKMLKMRHKHSLTWNLTRNIQKSEKCEMHTVGFEISREKLKKT